MGGGYDAGGRGVAVRVDDISMRFGGTQALGGISLAVEAGSIHGLVGENGAGKSTLLGILTGRIRPDDGTVEAFGHPVAPGRPRAAQAAGIAAIYQELTIVPAMSAETNVFLGRFPSRHGLLDRAAMRERYDRLCSRLGIRIPPAIKASRLSPAQQQLLEIMRALDAGARVLLLDEPTACLGPPERESLFRLMAELRAGGVAMVFVSHELDEVLRLADRITVLRAGRIAATAPRPEWSKPDLVRAMLGPPVDQPSSASVPGPIGHRCGAVEEELLAVEDLTVPGVLTDVTLTVRRGEIVGIGGLVGSGRSTLLRCLAGLQRPCAGELRVAGVAVPWPRSVRAALGLGLALVPEDRRNQGLLPALSAKENVTVTDLGSISRGPFVSSRAMTRKAREATAVFRFDARRLDETVRNLSGGNQQKLLLSRWRHRCPTVLLADEPCRGVDIGSRAEILAALRRQADAGLGVLMVSSQLEEVAEVCDRVVVLAGGRRVAVLDATSGPLTAARILLAAYGSSADEP